MSQRLIMKRLLTFASHRSRFGSVLLQYNKNSINHTVRHFNQNFNNFNKAVTTQQTVDLLMQNIRMAGDTCDVLYNVQQHHAIMNDAHTMQALQTIFLLQKSQQSTVTNGELVKHDSFILLCKTLQHKVRYLELNDHLNALKVLSFVGVSSTHKTVQILLQLISKRVNDLSLQQIVFLDFMLKDFDSCPLVDALKMALPIVFEVRFKYESNISDAKQLMDLFIYAVKKRLSDDCIDLFANKLNEIKDNIDVESSKVIVRTLCEAKRSETPFRNLLHLSLDNIVDNIDKFSFFDLNYILARLSTNFNKKYGNHYYHEEFLNTVANYIVDKKCDAEQATWVLKSCNKFKHTHKGIVDYVCEKISENPSSLDKWSLGMLVSLINSLSILDYRPGNFSLFQENIVNNLLKFSYKMELPWLRVALDLCSLDCWPHDLFNIILDEEFLNRFLKRGNVEDIFELIQLYQAIVTLCPSYQGNLPSPALISETMEKIRKLEYRDKESSPLLAALTHGLGGPSYVFSPAYTKLGHFIDHAIVMRKGGYPISINNNSSSESGPVIIEDLQLPEDSQIILLLFLTPKYYTVNTERILGHIRLNINTLEAMGFSVVSMLESTWENLLDGERIPYIMQALQNKCQDLENVAASHT